MLILSIAGMIGIAALVDKIWVEWFSDYRSLEGMFIVAFIIFCMFCGMGYEKGIISYHKESKK